MKEYSIYGLFTDNPERFFYIGITMNPIEIRLSDHLSNTRTGVETNKKKSLVIIDNKFSIKITCIELFYGNWKDALKREVKVINKYLLEGHPLTNKISGERQSVKTLKIPQSVHKELKVYLARTGENMTDFSGLAIMEKLKSSGHKFILSSRKSKIK